MALNKKYMMMDTEQRAGIRRAIGITFDNIDRIKYPAISENIQNDESRLAVIETIISEMFGSLNNLDMEEALNITEITLSE